MSTKDIFKIFSNLTDKNKTNIISFLESGNESATINAPISKVHIEFRHYGQYKVECMLPSIYGPIYVYITK